jgi:hypothetical protein
VDQKRPMVISPGDAAAPPGPATPGMDRRQLLDEADRWIGWVGTTPGMAGGWHLRLLCESRSPRPVDEIMEP